MRKLSLLAAAMVAGGSAFAMDGGGVSISGEANFGVTFKEDRDPGSQADLQFHHEFDIKFAASGTTDGGVSFGAKMTLDNQESTDIAVSGGVVTPGSDGTAESPFKRGSFYWQVGDTDKQTTAATFGNEEEPNMGRPGAERPPTPAELTAYRNAASTGVFGGTVADAATDTTATNKAGLVFSTDGVPHFARVTTTGAVGALNPEITHTTAAMTGWRLNNEGQLTSDETTRVTAPGAREAYNAYVAAYDIGEDGIINAADEARAKLVITDHEPAVEGTPATAPTITPVKASGGKVGNHAEVYISMDMHKLTIGSDIDAADKIAGGLTDPGFDGIGIDDQAEAVWGDTAADVRYDGDFGVAKVAISYGDNNDDAEWAAGFSFDVEPVTMGAGFDSNGVVSLGMGFSQGQIAMNALYSTDSDGHESDNEAGKYGVIKPENIGTTLATDGGNANLFNGNAPDVKNQAMGVDVTYKMNDTTSLVLVAAQHTMEGATWQKAVAAKDAVPASGDTPAQAAVQAADGKWVVSDTKVDAFGVGFAHDLGGGATLKAGAGSVDSNAVADLGITMKF
ncbi:MAG: porin [Rhodobacteraceae bacterium]|nr:porin [Paracoccaceae bacterium]